MIATDNIFCVLIYAKNPLCTDVMAEVTVTVNDHLQKAARDVMRII